MLLILNAELKKHFSDGPTLFDTLMSMQGEIYRELEGRRTQRISINQKNYFFKQHFGIGWKEIFKNLLQLRLPVISAKNEWCAIQRLQTLNVHTLNIAGFGQCGRNPAKINSFIITDELPSHASLEDLCKDWKKKPPSFSFKQKLLKEVARIARALHENGINHRDFYLCHFLLDLSKCQNNDIILYLIDLHRAQLRARTPLRWIIKDLAGLYFSSKDIGLTKRDRLRFMSVYRQKPLRELFLKDNQTEFSFWQKVKKRGDQLYQKHEK